MVSTGYTCPRMWLVNNHESVNQVVLDQLYNWLGPQLAEIWYTYHSRLPVGNDSPAISSHQQPAILVIHHLREESRFCLLSYTVYWSQHYLTNLKNTLNNNNKMQWTTIKQLTIKTNLPNNEPLLPLIWNNCPKLILSKWISTVQYTHQMWETNPWYPKLSQFVDVPIISPSYHHHITTKSRLNHH